MTICPLKALSVDCLPNNSGELKTTEDVCLKPTCQHLISLRALFSASIKPLAASGSRP